METIDEQTKLCLCPSCAIFRHPIAESEVFRSGGTQAWFSSTFLGASQPAHGYGTGSYEEIGSSSTTGEDKADDHE